MKLEKNCFNFFEVGHRTVFFLVGNEIVVYENDRLVHTAKEHWETQNCTVFNSKLYFLNRHRCAIEFDCESFETKQVLSDVKLMDGVPGHPDFLAVSWDNQLCAASPTLRRALKEFFPNMGDCYWNAVLSFRCFAVVAGYSWRDDLQGNRVPKASNFFLLVRFADLEVLNQENPLTLAWHEGTSIA